MMVRNKPSYIEFQEVEREKSWAITCPPCIEPCTASTGLVWARLVLGWTWREDPTNIKQGKEGTWHLPVLLTQTNSPAHRGRNLIRTRSPVALSVSKTAAETNLEEEEKPTAALGPVEIRCASVLLSFVTCFQLPYQRPRLTHVLLWMQLKPRCMSFPS